MNSSGATNCKKKIQKTRKLINYILNGDQIKLANASIISIAMQEISSIFGQKTTIYLIRRQLPSKYYQSQAFLAFAEFRQSNKNQAQKKKISLVVSMRGSFKVSIKIHTSNLHFFICNKARESQQPYKLLQLFSLFMVLMSRWYCKTLNQANMNLKKLLKNSLAK